MSLDASKERRKTEHPSDEGHRTLRHDFPQDEAQKNYHTILEQQTARAEEELGRPALALFLSGITAGLDLGFGPLAMAVTHSLLVDTVPPALLTFIQANMYSIGFVFVVLGYSALFTEQTASAIQPVLSRRATVRSLLRLWMLVLAANLIGCALFSLFAVVLGPALGIVELSTFGEIAGRMLGKPFWVMVLSGLAAGWLMGLMAWLVIAARDTVSQLICVWLTTAVIGLSGLHHSIAGSVEILMAVFAGQGATLLDYAHFLVAAVIGNLIGGVFFVAGLKYSHIRQTQT